MFCAFNNPLKITPTMFDLWMGLLAEVSDSLLWLRAGVPEARRNLEQAARSRGVDPSRLVFAGPIESTELHLARHRLADLFLDTFPYNGHSTACDALWAGLPLLTCRGRSFASRVGASLLQAADLPELITDAPQAYWRLALALAREPGRLRIMREKLTRLRAAGRLFDTAQYCRRFEAALTADGGPTKPRLAAGANLRLCNLEYAHVARLIRHHRTSRQIPAAAIGKPRGPHANVNTCEAADGGVFVRRIVRAGRPSMPVAIEYSLMLTRRWWVLICSLASICFAEKQ